MAEQSSQNYANHAKIPTTLMVVAILKLIGIILAVIGLFKAGTTAGTCLIGTGFVVFGLGGIFGNVVARLYSTALQDRIIRTEMRVRLAGILPEKEQESIAQLSMKQLVGLRFESDENLPELVKKVLSDNIESATEIKKLVKDWQADLHRV